MIIPRARYHYNNKAAIQLLVDGGSASRGLLFNPIMDLALHSRRVVFQIQSILYILSLTVANSDASVGVGKHASIEISCVKIILSIFTSFFINV